jgi:O-antigen/teichoic acid export membrane protein
MAIGKRNGTVDSGAGWCIFAFRLLGKGSLPGGVLDGFYRQAAEIARERPEAMRGFLLATALRLFLVALPFGLALWFVAPRLAPWIFGSAWHETGRMMAVMAPWMVAQVTVGSVSRVVFLSNWSALKLIYDTLALTIIAGLFLAGPPDWHGAIRLLSWSTATLYVRYGVVLYLIVGAARLAGPHKCVEER